MKGLKGILGLTFLSSMFLLAACSSQTNNSSTTEKNDKPIVLKTTIQTPPVASLSKGFDAYLDVIEEKSEGKIKFERYYSESLLKTGDVLNALSSGIADVGVIVAPLVEAKFH